MAMLDFIRDTVVNLKHDNILTMQSNFEIKLEIKPMDQADKFYYYTIIYMLNTEI